MGNIKGSASASGPWAAVSRIGEIDIDLPADTNTSVLRINIASGQARVQYYSTASGAWINVGGPIDGNIFKITVKMWLQHSSNTHSYDDLGGSGTLIVAWTEQNSQSGATYDLLPVPADYTDGSLSSSPFTVNDDGSVFISDIEASDNIEISITSSTAVQTTDLEIPFEVIIQRIG